MCAVDGARSRSPTTAVHKFGVTMRSGSSMLICVIQGRTSLTIFESILHACPGQSFTMFLIDQPGNDWATTRQMFSNWPVEPSTSTCFTSRHDIEAALAESNPSPIRIFLCGISFFEQVLPDGILDIAISGSALQWLSQRPHIGAEIGFLGGTTFRSLPQESRIGVEDAAAQDWERILRHRNRETKPGARMFYVIPGYNILSTYCPFTWHDYSSFMERTLTELLSSGTITHEQSFNAVQAVYFRSNAEFEAPFYAGHPAVDGMSLLRIDWRTFQNTDWDDDPDTFAWNYRRSLLAVVSNIWQTAFPEHVTTLLRERLLDDIKTNPLVYKDNWLQAYVTIAKH